MCGVAGILKLDLHGPPELGDLQRMVAALRHRGPDECGLYRDRDVGLAHTRLSIVDLSSGKQPMSYAGGRFWISYNGEVYNHVDLRTTLERSGHRFRTRCDTEVVLASYAEWGEACLERFEGQFAFALWDKQRHRLLLARDRLGVRPLLTTRTSHALYFASEAKALFQVADVPRRIDPVGLDHVFTFWSVVAPRTIFEGIHEVEPGHFWICEPHAPARAVKYFEPAFDIDRTISFAEAASGLENLLEQATVVRRVQADVPVGCYVSGGIDSALIAALANRAHGGALRTFSIRFEDPSFDEGPYQRAVVEQLETHHDEVHVTGQAIADAFPEAMLHIERPILRTAPIPLFLLSRAVRAAGIKVVLTGEGADEMFGGYDLFREAKIRRFWAKAPHSPFRFRLFEKMYGYLERPPAQAREMAHSFFGRDLTDTNAPDYSHRPRFRAAGALKRLFSQRVKERLAGYDSVAELCGALPPAFASWDPLARAQFLEIRTLLSGYLLSAQGDRVAMAHSVEGRFPFLDSRVMSFANALPPSFKLNVMNEKFILKDLARSLIPKIICERKKQPYRAPDAVSFIRKNGAHYVDEMLSERSLRESDLFDARSVTALVSKCRSRAPTGALSHADNMAFVGVLSTQLLWNQMVRSVPQTEPVDPHEFCVWVDVG